MSTNTLLNYLLAVAIIVIVPGPNIILIMNNSIKHGFSKGILTILGIKVGMILLFAISLSGIATILLYFSSIFLIIKWLGVLYLIYLGISQIIGSFKESRESNDVTFEQKYFLKGVLISVTNPKGLIFAGAFFPQFINTDSPLMVQSIILSGGFIIVSMVIELLYAFFSSQLSNFLKKSEFQKMLDRISGVIFILFGFGLSLYKKSS
ncbi:MAG: LysE family translocator [Spirochaetales bacterium]|nr:LysE family translocator [Spirochaetales bacterium]